MYRVCARGVIRQFPPTNGICKNRLVRAGKSRRCLKLRIGANPKREDVTWEAARGSRIVEVQKQTDAVSRIKFRTV